MSGRYPIQSYEEKSHVLIQLYEESVSNISARSIIDLFIYKIVRILLVSDVF